MGKITKNCPQVKNLLTHYFKQELSNQETKTIEMHLSECPVCQKEYQEIKSLFEQLTRLQPTNQLPYPAEYFLPQLRRKISNRATPRKSILPRLIPVLGSAVIIFAIVIFSYLNHIQELKKETALKIFRNLTYELVSPIVLYDNLDTEIQESISNSIITEISSSDLQTIDTELLRNVDIDDLLSRLTEDEKQNLVNELINKYKKNNLDPVKNIGGKNG